MAAFDLKKYWWLMIIAAAVIGVAILLITQQWLPQYQNVGALIAFGVIGIAFCWVNIVDKERLWWAIIPGLGLFTFMAAVLSEYVIGTDPKNDWLNVLVLCIGTAIIALVVKRMDAKLILFIVAMFMLLIGISMSPLTLVLKSVLIIVSICMIAFYGWSYRNTLPRAH